MAEFFKMPPLLVETKFPGNKKKNVLTTIVFQNPMVFFGDHLIFTCHVNLNEKAPKNTLAKIHLKKIRLPKGPFAL